MSTKKKPAPESKSLWSASRDPRPRPPKKPLFERGDVVKLIGIQSPDMLVSDPPELNELGEYDVTCVCFGFAYGAAVREDYSSMIFYEGLLQLVKPAAKVREEAEAATKEARGQY